MPKRQKQKKEKKVAEESASEEEREKEEEEAEEEEEEKDKEKAKEEDAKGDPGKPAESSDPSGESVAAAASSAASPPPPPEFKAHSDYPPMQSAIVVTYSPFSGLPPDFCQFGPNWDKDKPWCMENCPEYYPELSGVSLEDAKKTAEDASKPKEKLLPGGKKKRDASPHIFIRKLTRGGRKCVTTVNGLETFGVNMDDVAKKFKKKFACGCAVVKDNAGCDLIEIQGDFEEEVVDALCDQFPVVTPDKVSVMDSATKKKGKGK